MPKRRAYPAGLASVVGSVRKYRLEAGVKTSSRRYPRSRLADSLLLRAGFPGMAPREPGTRQRPPRSRMARTSSAIRNTTTNASRTSRQNAMTMMMNSGSPMTSVTMPNPALTRNARIV
jgi:hypothetical protein